MHFSRPFATLLLVLCFTVGLSACKPPPAEEVMEDDDIFMEGNTTNEFTGTVEDLMKDNKDITCTFTRIDNGMTMNGTVYVARDGRMNGDFTMEGTPMGTMTMHVIRDGSYGYTWGYPNEQTGMKIELDDDGEPTKEDENSPDFDDPMDFECSTWKVDRSKFIPPSNVDFQDISEAIEQIDQAMGSINDAQCDACNQVPAGPGRDQCLQALGC